MHEDGKVIQSRRGGFTLIELLVVIGIIVLLIGILIPTVTRVRRSAQEASTKSLISQLQGAIEQYFQTFHAYPGPLTNNEIYFKDPPPAPSVVPPIFVGTTPLTTRTTISMSENLVLGLLGGLKLDPTLPVTIPISYVFDSTLVGSGPRSLNPNMPKAWPSFLSVGDLSTGRFSDQITFADDSDIPEFVDRFSNPMPIIYTRARAGAAGVISDIGARLNDSQYELAQFISYTGTFSGAANAKVLVPATPPATGLSIGLGKDLDDYYVPPTGTATPKANVATLYHGLRTVTAAATMGPIGDPKYQLPFDAYPYFNAGTVAAPSARQKDGYILISAGKDRIYGTEDDITSFGTVAP